jgi:glycine hydroxymethyltransferase
LDRCDISLNKNTLHTDTNAFRPRGVRLGTPAMTTRGFNEKEFEYVV